MAENEQFCHGTGPYTCEVCQRRFPVKSTLTRHLNTVHRELSVQCSYCGQGFARKDILNRHIQNQHKRANEPIPCDRCGKHIRPRSIPFHQASDGCRRASSNTNNMVVTREWDSSSSFQEPTHCLPNRTMSVGSTRANIPGKLSPIMSSSHPVGQPPSCSCIMCFAPTAQPPLVMKQTSTERVMQRGPPTAAPQIDGPMQDVSLFSTVSSSDAAICSVSLAAGLHNRADVNVVAPPSHTGPQEYFKLDDLDATSVGMFHGDILIRGRTGTKIGTTKLSRQRRAKYTPTPNYLPAIADPVLLSAWLFIKLRPWGPSHRWADPDPFSPLREFSKPSVDILELRSVVYRTVRTALATGSLDRDPYFPDALIMLILFTCQTEGWDLAIVHCEPLVWLAERYLKGNGSRELYKTTLASDAFGTVLSRYIKNEYAEPLQRMFTMAQKVMRQTVIDLIDGPFPDPQEPVWRRPYHLNAGGWFLHYEDQLRPIIHIADSVPDSIERVREVTD